MVTQSQDHRQGQREPYGVFGATSFAPLALTTIRQLVARSPISTPSQRLVYVVLCLHADCRGDAVARAGDIAHDAGLDTEYARRVLRQLREAGHISKRPIRQGIRSVWHLSALRDDEIAAYRDRRVQA